MVIALTGCFILGLLVGQYYWRRYFEGREGQIHELEAALGEKEKLVQSLEARQAEQAASIERLRDLARQSEEKARELAAQVAGREQTVSQMEERSSQQEERIQILKSRAEEAEARVKELEQEVAALKRQPDDLKRIEGIGPKIAQVLQGVGIVTFEQLAATEVSRLGQILGEAEMKLADPATWPEQAGLAAAGQWDELNVFQDKLNGGRL